MRIIIRTKKLLPKKVHTKSGFTKTIFIDRCALIFRESFILFFYIILYNQQYKKQKWQMPWKKNWTPWLRCTEESIVKQNNFRVLGILCITNFCVTRKINSNAIRALFHLLNLQKSTCLENYLSKKVRTK